MIETNNPAGFYYIEVRSVKKYKTFRTLNVSEDFSIRRVIGQQADGIWETVKWLVGKASAHVEDGKLVAENQSVQDLFKRFDGEPKFISGNRFTAKEYKNIAANEPNFPFTAKYISESS